ncbi:PorT family protein [Algoriphagus halophytocola]|uniref:PorT family protein n=1 Tax=Algoriphagus halophytocola TaxID=2991499 RepID=A0ABY6MFU8_9BACT|nr:MULTISPECIES: PorT family protein [unclassified Algoriphagus]UZD21511.1 PorT family protein [Algoriphagus sp. TR-M5]WBL42723.1 PorT family protein [Algoriphagus sp. TR-M9]
MKNLLITLLLLLVFGTSLQAQNFKPGAGVNFTNMTQADDGVSGQAGWQVGASIAFGEKLYFEPGVFYMGKSAEFKDSDDLTSDDLKANLNGIRVPVAVGLNVLGRDSSTLALRVFGGGSGFFLTSVGDDFDKDDFNSTNWGVFAGAGVDIAIFFVDMSYEWSVTNLENDLDGIDLGKTNGFFITAGLRF